MTGEPVRGVGVDTEVDRVASRGQSTRHSEVVLEEHIAASDHKQRWGKVAEVSEDGGDVWIGAILRLADVCLDKIFIRDLATRRSLGVRS